MTPILPVSMIPISGSTMKSGGFVVAVLIGLALYMAHQKSQGQSTQLQ